MASILVVEDEQGLGRTLEMSLSDEGHDVHWVPSAEEASAWIAGHQVDLTLVDLRLPQRDGIELLREVASTYPDTSVVIMTAHGDVRTAVSAMKLGAADFLLKPVDLDAVSLVATKHLKQGRINRQWKHEQKKRSSESGLDCIIGECSEIQKAKAMVRRLGRIASSSNGAAPNMLITGETGTGKDLIARAVHYEGPRHDGPLVHVNCAALPESLAESELFGHVKGAFTDARTNKRGLFELADEGTLFLDEVCSLPLVIQAKLLTAIETRRIRPVGGSEEKSVDVHLVAAMNRDPEQLIAEGRFRADLYHRLRVVEIRLPPLRDRKEDLDLLAEHLVGTHCAKFQMQRKVLAPNARKALRLYHWPGNVRELSHCLETAVLLSGEMIEEEFMPRPTGRARPVVDGADDEAALRVDFSRGPIPLESIERELIVRAMSAADQNVSKAAELLAISRDTLRYRLTKYGISAPRVGAST